MPDNLTRTVYVKDHLPDYLLNWAAEQGIEISDSNHSDYQLFYQHGKLQLAWLSRPDFLPFSVEPPEKIRIKQSNLLFKAIGKHNTRVFDLTAGFGVDTMSLLSLGKSVFCVERCAAIAMLLYDGLSRAFLADRFKLKLADSIDWLAESSFTANDVIYLDPMFEGKKKSAKSVKSMQLLRHMAGDDVDAEQLVQQAVSKGARVVVKNHHKGPVMYKQPSFQYKGKTVRFDVYV